MKLVVYDPNTLQDTDILPIPPEMESLVIEYVLQALGLAQLSQNAAAAKNERKLFVFLIPTAHACIRTMVGWCRISLFRR